VTHPSTYELELLFADENGSVSIKSHVAQCHECRAFIEELQQAQTLQLQKESPAEFMASIMIQTGESKRMTQPSRFNIRIPVFVWAATVALLVAGASIFLYSRLQINSTTPSFADTDLRRKGAAPPVVEVYINRNNNVHISRGATILPGDAVQYRITIPNGETGYAAVVAKENGNLQSVFPPNGVQTPLAVKGTFELPGAIWVEKNTTDLSLYLILNPEPFEMSTLIEKMKQQLDTSGSVDNLPCILSIRSTSGVK
jgi:hypothetical protein